MRKLTVKGRKADAIRSSAKSADRRFGDQQEAEDLGRRIDPILRYRVDVARCVIGAIKKTVPVGVIMRIARVNGQPSVIYSRPDGTAGCVLSLDVVDNRLRDICVVTNPEKLTRLPLTHQRLM